MSREHDYYVYIVTNFARSVLYIGITNSLTRRIYEHEHGVADGFTQRYHVDRLIYYEHYNEVHDALEREKQLKGWSRAKKQALIAQMNPNWLNLNSMLDPRSEGGPMLATRDQGNAVEPVAGEGPSASSG